MNKHARDVAVCWLSWGSCRVHLFEVSGGSGRGVLFCEVFRGLVRICYGEVTGCLDITFCILRCLVVEVVSGLSRGLTGHCWGGPFCIF